MFHIKQFSFPGFIDENNCGYGISGVACLFYKSITFYQLVDTVIGCELFITSMTFCPSG